MKKVLIASWQLWKRIAHKLGQFNTWLLLTIFYFLIISPLGALMRACGWDPLRGGRPAQRAKSNWQPVKHSTPDLESLRRQS